MSATKVSVVIPFYKRQAVFDETLRSVLNQTVKPYEIIVVDDASGGDATEFLNQYKDKIKLITLVENGGVSNARNVGADAVEGDLIAFQDSDDIWMPEKLELQLDYLEKHPECDVVHTGCINFFPDGKELVYDNKPEVLEMKHLIQSSHIMFQSVLMKKEVFIKAGGFDKRFRQTEDYEYSMRIVTKGYQVHFIKNCLVRIRHGSSDKLSINWKGFIYGHIRVVQMYGSFYKALEGPTAVYKHSVKYIVKGGYKCGGPLGLCLRIIGKILYPMAT